MTEKTVHQTLIGLWSRLMRSGLNDKHWRILLDDYHWSELAADTRAQVDGSLVYCFEKDRPEWRWRGSLIVRTRAASLPSTPEEWERYDALSPTDKLPVGHGQHRIVSFAYRLRSGRVCYLDSDLTDTYFREGELT